jgi:hypothetical protein
MNSNLYRLLVCGVALSCGVLVLLAGLDLPRSADACGTASRAGIQVRVAEESAIVLWDAAAKVQHFIRRATFDANTPDFAFLVPTPTQPTLHKSRDEAFAFLEKLTVPRIVKEYVFVPKIGCGSASKKPADVRVLEEGRVAGFDYKIFETATAQDLYDWLKKNDYVTRPDLKEWVEPYVQKKWKFTVFKIAKDAKKQEIATSAVRMSFSAEKPFFPYSEPAEQRDTGKPGRRLLRVFFVGEKRYAGVLGDEQTWPGRTVWAGQLQPESVQTLGSSLEMPINISTPWLTVFEDDSSPRPGTHDVFFSPSSVQDEVYRTVHIRQDLSGWTCLGIAAIFVFLLIVLAMRRRRRVA